MDDTGVVLRAENVSKRFGGVQALDRVSFELRRGEVHALVGENGAGKSTLIKIICGVYTKDSGRILYQDREVDFRDNLQARMAGIGIVPQEIQLAPKLTVAENIFMGMYPRGRGGLISWRTLRQRAVDIARTFNMEKFIDAKVESLGTGHRQLIEILKALIFETHVIAFDEPTAALSDEETRELFALIAKLKDRGISLIYVSHRLDEIFQIANRVTVFKDGQVRGDTRHQRGHQAPGHLPHGGQGPEPLRRQAEDRGPGRDRSWRSATSPTGAASRTSASSSAAARSSGSSAWWARAARRRP